METITLNATPRTITGKAVAALRRDGKTPAVLYGMGKESLSLTIDSKAMLAVYKSAGYSTLVDVVIDNAEPVKVLIADIALHPVTDRLAHVDFLRVDLKKKVHAKIPLKFVGESAAVKTLGGTLVAQLDEIEIECLPGDLLHFIEVDISGLKTFDDILHVRDIKIPETVTTEVSGDVILALVQAPRTEEELKALDTAVVEDVAQVAKVEKEKKEEVSEEETK